MAESDDDDDDAAEITSVYANLFAIELILRQSTICKQFASCNRNNVPASLAKHVPRCSVFVLF